MRQVGGEYVGKNPCQRLLGRKSYAAADNYAEYAEHQELCDGYRNNKALRRAEAFHERDGIHASMRKTARRHGHGNST